MSDKKKSKRRKDEYTGPGGVDKVTDKAESFEFKIAKWMRRNVPTKKTKFLNHNVQYFTSSKALDALMGSKLCADDARFATRESAIDFMDVMLEHKFFHRAKKVPVSEAELRRGKKGPASEKPIVEEKTTLKKRNTKKETTTEAAENAAESSHVEGGKDDGGTPKSVESKDKEKKKRKIRLDMHPEQVFVDGNEAYVWIYDPIPFHYWVFGALMVVAAIVVCLFPLWPPFLRQGVYYLSVAAAGFLVFILALAVLRFIVFCAVWLVTRSKHHLWLFPNLTEDVGFFASFWPIYMHTVQDGTVKDKKI